MLRGERLPAIAGGARFWGDLVLAPLGFRPKPDLPEPADGQDDLEPQVFASPSGDRSGMTGVGE